MRKAGRLGSQEAGRLGDWEAGRLGSREAGRLRSWEAGRLRSWEVVIAMRYALCAMRFESAIRNPQSAIESTRNSKQE
jgi:hypothetical protein